MGKKKEDGKDGRKTAWGDKTKSLTVTLTEEGWIGAKERAKELGIPVSEVVERWGRKYDVNFDDSLPIPPQLDSRASVAKSMSAIEIHEALGEKLEEVEVIKRFLENLGEGKATSADVAELAGLLDWDDAKAQGLIQRAKLGNGDRKKNAL
jgi:hypothetical protein